MADVPALLNPELLSWAREEAGLRPLETARRVGVDLATYEDWESGDGHPTVRQAKRLAKAFQISFSVFYLPEPPKKKRQPTDFRSFSSSQGVLSPELRAELRQARFRRQILLELLTEEELGEPFYLKVKPSDPIGDVITKVRNFLGVSIEQQRKVRKNEIFKFWRERFEDAGILVFQFQEVPLEEVRGAALYADFLPVIFVNVKDNGVARVFSLFHELAHLMLRSSSVCTFEEEGQDSRKLAKVEIFCNAVAGQTLVPLEVLRDELDKRDVDSSPDDETLRRVANSFKVSRTVICRRMLDSGLVSKAFYQAKQQQFSREWETSRNDLAKKRRERKRKTGKSGGPPPSTTLLSSAGKAFVGHILSSYADSRISSAEAARFLGLRLKHIPRIEGRF